MSVDWYRQHDLTHSTYGQRTEGRSGLSLAVALKENCGIASLRVEVIEVVLQGDVEAVEDWLVVGEVFAVVVVEVSILADVILGQAVLMGVTFERDVES